MSCHLVEASSFFGSFRVIGSITGPRISEPTVAWHYDTLVYIADIFPNLHTY